MDPQPTQRPRRGFLAALRARRDAVRSREGADLAPPVERLQPWSMVALGQGAYYALVGAWPLVQFIQLGFIALWGAAGIAEEKASRRPPIAAHA